MKFYFLLFCTSFQPILGFSYFPFNSNIVLMFFHLILDDNAIQILTSCTLGIADSPLLKEKKWKKTTIMQCWLFFLWVYYLCHVTMRIFKQRCHFVKQACVCAFFCDCLTSGHWFIGRGNLTHVLWIQ